MGISLDFVNFVLNSKAWGLLIRIERFIMFCTTAIMLLTIGGVVVARYVLHVDLFGYDEIVLIDSFWMYFVGAAFAMSREEHVKADILVKILSPKSAAVMKFFAGAIQTTASVVVTVLAFDLVKNAIETWAVTSSWNIPFFIPQMSILLSFIVMTFYLFIFTLRDYNNMVSLKKEG